MAESSRSKFARQSPGFGVMTPPVFRYLKTPLRVIELESRQPSTSGVTLQNFSC